AMQALIRKNLALGQAMDEARAAARTRSRLLAMASHEVRTPLNAVMGFLQALGHQRLTPAQADLARGAQEGGAQLVRPLDRVLGLAAADADDAPLNPGPFDLRRMAEGCVAVWRSQARALGVELAFDDADPALSFAILADGAKVEQALVCLVSNAVRATPAGGR